ncbi:MAG: dihydropteroate synthase [Cyclobacteriaceae bacterium]
MGIINLTPDSFYKGSRLQQEGEILKRAEKMLEEGATFLDIGGYSSRPGAEDISIDEEIKRTAASIQQLTREFPDLILSIDTFRSKVAKEAVESGASIVNDISGGDLDSEMFDAVASMKVPYIGMHMRGTPQNMVKKTDYDDLLAEVVKSFSTKIPQLHKLGVHDVIIDPGFGFAKSMQQNFDLLGKLEHFKSLEKPILVGLSRKSMIYKTLSIEADKALNGTTVLNTVALLKGASILRVHDVKEAMEAIKLVNSL